MKAPVVKALTGFIVLFGLYHGAEYAILYKNSSWGFLGFQFLFFISAWLIGRWQFGTGLSSWGLDRRKYFLVHLLMGMLMGILLYGITFLISISTGAEEIAGKPNYSSSLSPFALFIFGNFFSSFSEDILTRGYVFRHLDQKVSPLGILFISAIIYVLNHIYRLGNGAETLLYLFVLGVLFIIPLLQTRRLWFTGGMHWAGNCVFYFTHGIIKTDDGMVQFTANFILVVCALMLIAVNYALIKWMQKKWPYMNSPYAQKQDRL
jgi:membrane protease YdiL (CAAX protease family)